MSATHARRSVRRPFHRSAFLRLERLEDRTLLDAANIFAGFAGELVTGEARDTVRVHLTASNFAIGGGHATLGFLVRPGAGSVLAPNPVEVDSVAPGNVPVITERMLADGSSLVLAKLKHGDHDIRISGNNNTLGTWQLQVFLAGDVTGDFVVNTTDQNLIRDAVNGTIPNPSFFLEADANRDGQLTGFDLARASENGGIATSVRVLFVDARLDPAADTGVAGDNLVNQTPVPVIGQTLVGAQVLLDKDGDGFDDGSTTAGAGTPSYTLSAALVPGANTLRVEARDSFGQTVRAQTVVTYDNEAPTVASTTPAANAVVESEPGVNVPVTIVFSEPMIASSVLAGLSVSGEMSGPITPLGPTYDAATNTLRFELSEALTDNAITVRVAGTATDLAGTGLSGGTFTLIFNVNRIPIITEMSPANGEEMVGLAREAIIRFSGRIDPATITSDSIKLIALGATVPGRLVVSSTERFATFYPDHPWNESTEVRIQINGSLIRGRSGKLLDADGDGTEGGTRTADFRTLPLTRIAGTNLFGYIYDSFNKLPGGADRPIVGATVRLDAFPEVTAVTDATGRFELRDLPAPEFFVHVDGTTATNAPAGFGYPSVGKPFHSVPGQTVQLNMGGVPFDIYLPPMAAADVVPLSPTAATDVGFGDEGKAQLQALFPDIDAAVWDRMQVTYPAGSARSDGGVPATQAVVIPVAPDRIPAPLPANLNPRLVVSIQAMDEQGREVTNFDVPAPVTFPNLDGLAPGEKSLIFSFNHDAGRWDVIGTGTVSEDGLVIVSDPGVGVRAPGWHFVISGSPGLFRVGTSQNNEYCGGDDFNIRSNGLFSTIDNAFNGAINTIIDLVNYLPLVDIPNVNFTPIESTLRTAIRLEVNLGTRLKGGDPAVTVPYYDWFMEGRGGTVDVTAPPGGLANLEAEVRADSTHMTAFNNLKKKVTDLITQEIQSQANNGAVNLNLVKQRVMDSLAGSPDVKTVTFGRGNSFVIIHGTQFAQVDIEDLRASGNIPVPGQGGTGEWTATIIYRLFDDFGFDFTNDVGGHFSSGVTHLGNALSKINTARIEVGEALDSIFSLPPDFPGAYSHANAAIDAIVAAANEVKEAAEEFGIATLFLQLHALQRFGSAVPYKLEIPIDDPIDGDFTIPPGYEDVIIQGVRNAPLNGPLTGPSTISTVPGFGSQPEVYYRYLLASGIEVAGRARDGVLVSSVVLPSNQPFTATFYVPRINSSAVIAGRASASGQPAFVAEEGFSGQQTGLLEMNTFGGQDSDGDGIPDIGEFVLGTNKQSADSDGDGISDSAELEQGLDPLDGRAFPTGIISSLPLSGEAKEIAVEGSTLTPGGQTAYIATGSHGLAIVDGSRFNNPIVLGQLDLSGDATDVAIDGNLGIAAVASNAGGLHFVNVADPMTPALLRTINVAAGQVEVIQGIAYVTVGTTIRAYDLLTGAELQNLALGGSTLTGMAREGTFLYTMDAARRLRAIDLSGFTMVARGSLVMPDGGGKLFVGNGIAYVAAPQRTGSSGAGGFATANVTNPSSLTLISAADFNFGASGTAPGAAIGANGSGLGALVGDNFGQNQLFLMDLTNPSNTATLQLTINLPPSSGGARSVALASGIAFVAAGTSGLQVVNYLPFDNQGVAPLVTASTTVADVDPVTPGIQVLEGTSLPIRAAITDDRQVRNVELLVNGQVVANDVSFPFDFFAIAPNIAGSVNTFTVQVRAIDTGGNATLSTSIAIGLVEDTFAPTIASIEPPTGAAQVEPLTTVRVRFSEAMSADTLSASTIRLRDTDDNYFTPTSFQIRNDDRLAQLIFAPLTLGSYEIVISAASITDRAGNVLGAAEIISPFSLTSRASLSTAVSDDDPAPGLQVFEGRNLPLTVNVVPGVNVGSVEFLLNGVVIATDTAAPFTANAVAPNIALGADSFTLQARVTDTGGLATLTNQIIVGLLEDVTPPTVLATNPADGGKTFKGITNVQVTFSEGMAASTFSTANFVLVEAGPGGVFDDGNDVPILISAVGSTTDDTVAQLTVAALQPGLHRLTVLGAGIADRADNAGTGTFTSTFTVEDRPGLTELLNLRGTPVAGNVFLTSDKMTLAVNTGGSLIVGGTGLVFDGREFVIHGSPVWNYSVTYNGGIYANGSGFTSVSRENLSTGSFHGYRFVGTLGSGVRMERVIGFFDGDEFAVFATRLTNLTGSTLNNVAMMENTDPDQGIPINGSFNTLNDVVLGGDLVRSHAAGGLYPGGLTLGFGSADPRAVTSAEGFSNISPYDIINSPVDPNGASNDIGINLAINYGTVPAFGTVVGGLIVALGKSVSDAEQTYQQAAPITLAGALLHGANGGTSDAVSPVTAAEVQPLADAAAQIWADALGLAVAPAFTVRVIDLPAGQLGVANLGALTNPAWASAATVLIDADADGHGWFVDATPFDSSEFAAQPDGAQVAPAHSLAAGRYDLLTVLLHEAGHLFGFEHGHEGGLMGATLPPGVRHLPGLDAHEAESSSLVRPDAPAMPASPLVEAVFQATQSLPSNDDLPTGIVAALLNESWTPSAGSPASMPAREEAADDPSLSSLAWETEELRRRALLVERSSAFRTTTSALLDRVFIDLGEEPIDVEI